MQGFVRLCSLVGILSTHIKKDVTKHASRMDTGIKRHPKVLKSEVDVRHLSHIDRRPSTKNNCLANIWHAIINLEFLDIWIQRQRMFSPQIWDVIISRRVSAPGLRNSNRPKEHHHFRQAFTFDCCVTRHFCCWRCHSRRSLKTTSPGQPCMST